MEGSWNRFGKPSVSSTAAEFCLPASPTWTGVVVPLSASGVGSASGDVEKSSSGSPSPTEANLDSFWPSDSSMMYRITSLKLMIPTRPPFGLPW